MRFVDAWAKEIWPVIQADYERLQAQRPAKQDANAVGAHYGPKLLEVIALKGEVRNVTCNLTWTGGTANTPLQADITMALVTAFAMDMYMSNAMLQPSASDGKLEDAAAGSQDAVESAEPAIALSESVTKKRVLDIPKYVPKWYNIPIALTSTTTEPGKGEFRRLGMDAAVNGTWLAYKWAIEDGDEAAKAALESLILNWPFDFHLFQSDAADSAAPKLEDKILQFMVNIPLETERLRDFFGLEGKHLMMIVAKVREVIRMQKPSKATPTSSEIHTWPAQSIQRCSVSRPMGWKGANHSVAQNPKFAFFVVGPRAGSKHSGF